MSKLIKLTASCFYLGYISFASGTFGSLFGLGIYFLISQNSSIYLMVTLLFIALGFLATARAEKIFGQKDPKEIVIDEAAGMLVALLFIAPKIIYLTAGFLLFRFFDIVKPFPLKKLEKLSGASGIMFDDLGAAVYANLILQCLIFLKII